MTQYFLTPPDRHYEMRQLRIFQKMVEKGQIYRQHRPVHYSPSSRTALAEAELEYSDNHVSHSVYVTFELDAKSTFVDAELQALVSNAPSVQLLVWTTTPWTLSANMVKPIHCLPIDSNPSLGHRRSRRACVCIDKRR